VLEDADGSLIVVDTGGWYKLCCPTSQLHKPDLLGAVYRVRKSGAPKVEDPRGLKIEWDKIPTDELARLIGDPRPAVRRRAMETLPQSHEDAFGRHSPHRLHVRIAAHPAPACHPGPNRFARTASRFAWPSVL